MTTPLLATLLQSDNATHMSRASQHLRAGGCVAFPTETVYGLGANALDAASVLSIFTFKGRPLTDPLIVHVASLEAAEGLLDQPPSQVAVLRALAARFWPGPLTLISKASPTIPLCVTAGTGFVGVRIPRHPVAHALLQQCGLPIAAPSANRFGHVSPTSASHVMDDLGHTPILILDGVAGSGTGGGVEVGGGTASTTSACAIGIESTVCRLETSACGTTTTLRVLRRGAISSLQLNQALEGVEGVGKVEVVVQSPATVQLHAAGKEKGKEEEVAQVAPGQLLTHYAPDIPAFLIVGEGGQGAREPLPPLPLSPPLPALGCAVMLDFGGQFEAHKGRFLAYRDLTAGKGGKEGAEGGGDGGAGLAATVLFAALRWAERVGGATGVLIADPRCRDRSEAAEAVRDRLFRAASGREVGWVKVAEGNQ